MRFILLAGVGTGLEPRTSAGPLASDVGFKETHLNRLPGTTYDCVNLFVAGKKNRFGS